jgi:hypothetical protein
VGCEANFVCVTCRKSYYCGYGSYGRIEERLAKAPRSEHDGHDTATFTEDFTAVDKDGDLCTQGQRGDEKWIIGYKDYDRIDCTEGRVVWQPSDSRS